MPITTRLVAHGTPEYEAAVALRRRILRTPLGLDFAPEQLAAEAADTHLAGFADGRLVATVVLSPYDKKSLKLRQMAVDEGLQGSGAGSALLRAAESHALSAGMSHMVLNARVAAQGFYERNGYAAVGHAFIEVTIPHVRMVKALQ